MKPMHKETLCMEVTGREKQNIAILLASDALLITGFFGLLFQEWNLKDAGAFFLPVVLVSVFFSWGLIALKRYTSLYGKALLLLVATLLVMVPLLRKLLAGSLGCLFNQIGEWRFLHTGWFAQAFENSGSLMPILLLIALLAGVLFELLTENFRGQLAVLPALIYLVLLCTGSVSFGLWGLFLTTASALALIAGISGSFRSWLSPLVLTAAAGAIALGIVLVFQISGPKGTAGEKLAAYLHLHRYETTKNPMPEGKLSDLGAWVKKETPALQISMENWSTQYLKGFQGGVYTGSAWEAVSPETVLEEKELLSALQETGFYPSSQIAEGWKSLGKEAENTISVTNTGACRAYQYLPYGADTVEQLNPFSVIREGTEKKSAEQAQYRLYPVEDSYLLMKELSDAAEQGKAGGYLEKEQAYRTFVKAHYLDIPDNVDTLLKVHKLQGEKGISSAQACRETRILLKDEIKMNEATAFYNHSGDFLEYMLNINPSGYSVQYATLAVMMLRSYGIPSRYVEGYYVPASLTRDLPGGAVYTVTEANASAWVEYYTDGVGWLVFDPTPTHTESIDYQFPVGEGNADLHAGNLGFSDNRKDLPETEKEEDDEIKRASGNRRPGFTIVKILLLLILLLLLLALIALVTRTILVRMKMRLQRARFQDPDPRVAVAAIICSLRSLVTQSLHIPESAFFENPDGMVTELLDMSADQLTGWKQTCDEIQFSRHEISEETREQAREWLQTTEDSWQNAVSWPRRFWQKYILCRVY